MCIHVVDGLVLDEQMLLDNLNSHTSLDNDFHIVFIIDKIANTKLGLYNINKQSLFYMEYLENNHLQAVYFSLSVKSGSCIATVKNNKTGKSKTYKCNWYKNRDPFVRAAQLGSIIPVDILGFITKIVNIALEYYSENQDK